MSEPKLTREQIERWRDWLGDTHVGADRVQLGWLCDMALAYAGAEADARLLNWLDTLQGRTRGVSWPIVTDMHASAGTWCIYLRTGIGSQIAAQGHGVTIREAIYDAMSR